MQKKIDVFVNLLTRCASSHIYQALPFVFDSIFKHSGHVVVVVSPLVNSNKDKVDKLVNLDILVASLSDISTENARGVRSKEMFEVEPARGGRPIFQTVWDFTN